jgi:hypothetical protein
MQEETIILFMQFYYYTSVKIVYINDVLYFKCYTVLVRPDR